MKRIESSRFQYATLHCKPTIHNSTFFFNLESYWLTSLVIKKLRCISNDNYNLRCMHASTTGTKMRLLVSSDGQYIYASGRGANNLISHLIRTRYVICTPCTYYEPMYCIRYNLSEWSPYCKEMINYVVFPINNPL